MSFAESPAPTGTLSIEAIVVAAVLARPGGSIDETLRAIDGQTMPTRDIVVVGDMPAPSTGHLRQVASIADLIPQLDPAVTHVWMIHDDARPRPDALAALVTEAGRVDASVAGSKVLRAGQEGMLESVGAATDVFGEAYSGLEDEEVDQEQYDVVRDVSFVSTVSLLVRRDLLRGLGGLDPQLPLEALSIDFSQRARLAGGRVVVVPSAEVVHHDDCVRGVAPWREQAGRIRATIKAYRPLTLLWVLPGLFLLGLLDGLVRLVLRPRNRLLDWLRAWGWNLVRLPSTLQGRRFTQRSRQVGDEELFRYQMGGAAVMRSLADEIAVRLDRGEDDGLPPELVGLLGTSRHAWQRPSLAVGLVVATVLGLGARTLLDGRLPAGGFALPLRSSPVATLSSYAGGWSFGGLGSPEAIHPSVGALATLQAVLFGNEVLATAVAIVVVLIAGALGMGRLLVRSGVGPWGRAAAMLVLLAGPATIALTGAGYWPGLLAFGALPWTLVLASAPPGATRGQRIGRFAGLVLTTGIVAMFAPVAIVLPAAALLLRWAMGAGPVGAALFALAAAVPAAVFLFPWALDAVPGFVTEGGLTWEPSLWVVVAAAVALAASLVGGDKGEAALAGWGAVLAALGAVVVALDLGREPSVAGILAASLGLAVLAGVATDLPRRREEREAPFPALSWVAALGGLALAVLALLVVPDGRLGLPPDRLTSALEFTEVLAAPRGPDRALLIGEPGSVPGEARVAPSGYAYRAVSAPMPTMDEAWLAEPLPGDEELAAVLAAIEQGRLVRPGAALAPFGIRWVIFLDPVTIAARFQTQLDMSPLTLAGGLSAYQSEVRSPRALVDGEAAWRFVPPGYQGGAADEGRVVVAENADPRWGEEWARVDWRNEASAAAGTVGFRADPLRRTMAMAAAGFAVLLAAVAIWGSTRRAKLPANGSTVAEPAPTQVGDRQ